MLETLHLQLKSATNNNFIGEGVTPLRAPTSEPKVHYEGLDLGAYRGAQGRSSKKVPK